MGTVTGPPLILEVKEPYIDSSRRAYIHAGPKRIHKVRLRERADVVPLLVVESPFAKKKLRVGYKAASGRSDSWADQVRILSNIQRRPKACILVNGLDPQVSRDIQVSID